MLRRTTGILAITAVLGIAAATPASADAIDTLDSYAATSSASALELTLGGLLGEPTTVTVSGTGASVTSAPEASADGQAITTPLFSTPGAPVTSTGAPVTGEDCLNVALPAPLNLLDIDITCVHTSAEVADGHPSSSSVSDEIAIDVISADAVATVVSTVVQPILEQALAGLEPVLTPLLGAGSVEQLVAQLLTTFDAGDVLMTITVAPTSSTASGSHDGILADASSGAASITLLPGLGPLATIDVAQTGATVVRDAVTGEPTLTPDFDVAAINPGGLAVLLDTFLTNAEAGALGPLAVALAPIVDTLLAQLDGLDETLETLVNSLGLGALACDGPLAAVACLSLGGVNELDETELQAMGLDLGAGAVGLEVTTLGLNVLDGTVNLALGDSLAAAAATPATPVTPDTPDTQRSLPRTGGAPSLPLTLALLGAGAAGLALVRRTRAV